MSEEIIKSERHFQIWKYTVGHCILLLRSTKSADCRTRIDVLFKGVREFHLPTSFTGLSITEATDEEIQRLCSLKNSPPNFSHGIKIFKVRGTDFTGYVAALIAVSHEDEGEYSDPSYFSKKNII